MRIECVYQKLSPSIRHRSDCLGDIKNNRSWGYHPAPNLNDILNVQSPPRQFYRVNKDPFDKGRTLIGPSAEDVVLNIPSGGIEKRDLVDVCYSSQTIMPNDVILICLRELFGFIFVPQMLVGEIHQFRRNILLTFNFHYHRFVGRPIFIRPGPPIPGQKFVFVVDGQSRFGFRMCQHTR